MYRVLLSGRSVIAKSPRVRKVGAGGSILESVNVLLVGVSERSAAGCSARNSDRPAESISAEKVTVNYQAGGVRPLR